MAANLGFDTSKSLEELEGEDWGVLSDESHLSNLELRLYRLLSVPLQEWTSEDLVAMLMQQVSPDYLVPLALAILEDDPWHATQRIPGRLLGAVLGVQPDWWAQPEDAPLRLRMRSLLNSAAEKQADWSAPSYTYPYLNAEQLTKAQDAFAAEPENWTTDWRIVEG